MRERRVQQADNVMDSGGHGLAQGLGVAVGDLHCEFLMVAQDHRRVVFAVIHQAVMQAAIACPGIERDRREVIQFDHIDDDVGLILGVRLADTGSVTHTQFAFLLRGIQLRSGKNSRPLATMSRHHQAPLSFNRRAEYHRAKSVRPGHEF